MSIGTHWRYVHLTGELALYNVFQKEHNFLTNFEHVVFLIASKAFNYHFSVYKHFYYACVLSSTANAYFVLANLYSHWTEFTKQSPTLARVFMRDHFLTAFLFNVDFSITFIDHKHDKFSYKTFFILPK